MEISLSVTLAQLYLTSNVCISSYENLFLGMWNMLSHDPFLWSRMIVEQPMDIQELVGVVSQLPDLHQKGMTTAGEPAVTAAAVVTQR